MEYERALFRVYDKSMEGFHSRGVRSACNLLQKLVLVASAGLFAALFLLHHQFVNKPGCLAPLLEEAASREGVLILPTVRSVTANTTLGEIDTDPEGVIVGGPNQAGGGGAGGGDDENEEEEEEDDRHPSKIQLPSGNWVPYDVMDEAAAGSAEGGEGGGEASSNDTAVVDGGGGEIGVNVSAVNDTGFTADYTFAFEPIVLLLPDKIQEGHGFKWVNFTMEPSVCLREAGFVSRLLAATVIGYDEIMVNMFMYSMRSKGLL
ncbi:hypothetical protein Esi_0064_0097 [Ectocarpus siliculosus]|uniref:Uncharacterized protein n=1 Tax=Ectocarpus siliculosus TaxID=2880 RepID=D8LRC9_ECTSI|nr:hypothetical protein Esi_0064_0097 [Ectocarpus siliculosus]|eukprot:CBN75034.1 hypothetical protein Esi_0064_0097 [Ectocarpus siliculosus]